MGNNLMMFKTRDVKLVLTFLFSIFFILWVGIEMGISVLTIGISVVIAIGFGFIAHSYYCLMYSKVRTITIESHGQSKKKKLFFKVDGKLIRMISKTTTTNTIRLGEHTYEFIYGDISKSCKINITHTMVIDLYLTDHEITIVTKLDEKEKLNGFKKPYGLFFAMVILYSGLTLAMIALAIARLS